jgi:hypothetical protein
MPVFLPLILKNWKLALGGMAMAFVLIYAAIQHASAVHWHKAADAANASYQLEVAKNAVQVASIDKLQAALDDQSRAVTQLAAESDTRTKAAQQALQAAQEAARASDGTARALDASAAVARADAGKCAPSDEFWNVARKDL